jgi:dTDP-glucose 4,6-dehydratase
VSENKQMNDTIFVTGGAGFIGSNFILNYTDNHPGLVVNFDKLTYAGNLKSLINLKHFSRHIFVQGDIGDYLLVQEFLGLYKPKAIINFAAETHVDNSIHSPRSFVSTNVVGACNLLEATRYYWQSLEEEDRMNFRFLHVSTDEVYGSLALEDPPFTEENPYRPNSPYAASKASSDHFVRSYHQTYGLPTITTNCSNNYGPFQYPEKLIPLIILNAVKGKILPIYGDGSNIRDWLYVQDHCNAINQVLRRGEVGQAYNIGGQNEITNLELVQTICSILDELKPSRQGSYTRQIQFVQDRLGHDRRYGIDTSKIQKQIGWKPTEVFSSGIRKTVQWYLDNLSWAEVSAKESDRGWRTSNYSRRN